MPRFAIWFYTEIGVPSHYAWNTEIMHGGSWGVLADPHSKKFAPYFGA